MLDFSRVKSKLLVEYPYFGTLSSGLEIVVNDNIESFTLHGNCFEYREDFFNTLSDEQVAFSLSNAALHTVLSHPSRIGNRSPWLWYTACEHAINNMLIDNDFTPPSKITYDPRFRGQYAEEIYEELLDTITREDLNDKDNDSRRNDEIPPDKLEVAQTEILSQNALQKAQEMGSFPEGLERLIPMAFKGVIDWRNELRDCIGGYYVSDYAMMPPSKKLLYAGIYLPSATSRHLELCIAIDSSGSVDEVLLAQFIAEVESITELFGV
jgi:predicted metal-dependent peptidase